MNYEQMSEIINMLYNVDCGLEQIDEDGISVLLMDLSELLLRRIDNES